jgi:hypothetical protein
MQQQICSGVLGENAVARAYVAAPVVPQPYTRDAVAPAPTNAQIADNTGAMVRAYVGQSYQSPPRMRLADGVHMDALHVAVMDATPAIRPIATTGNIDSAMVPAVGRTIVPLADPMSPDDDSICAMQVHA